jgi:peptide/nickel transport system ATP-binding protein
MSNGIPELKVENLVVHYRTEDGLVRAVNDVSFEVQRGATMGLVGETGAGKTTTALAMMRLIPSPPGEMVSGRILFAGKDIMEYSEKEMDKVRGDTVSMVFQDPMTSLNPVLTVGEQIAEVIMLHQHLSREEARRKTCEMLELVGIPGARAEEYPHQFSGGMKQRVVIAIALACNPQILIADEPTTALDVTIQAQVLEMMRGLKKQFSTAMILITHDLGVVADICDMVAIMYAGRIIEYGTLADIFDDFKHPYTEGLFGSLPNLQKRHEKLKPIKGLMPDPCSLPEGCYFHPRCKYATDACRKIRPERTYLSENHYVECLAYQEGSGVTLGEEASHE